LLPVAALLEKLQLPELVEAMVNLELKRQTHSAARCQFFRAWF
jgi:hypothetical protein